MSWSKCCFSVVPSHVSNKHMLLSAGTFLLEAEGCPVFQEKAEVLGALAQNCQYPQYPDETP